MATLITVTGTFEKAPGVPASGSVVFVLSESIRDQDGDIISACVPRRALLGSDGSFSIGLTATDDPDSVPTGNTYVVTERIAGQAPRSYQITVEHDAPGETIDLADKAPVDGVALEWFGITRGEVQDMIDGALTDASGIDYTPAVSGDWSPAPSKVGPALDQLAARESGGPGGGAVDSVNGETGEVVLDADDVGADPAGTAADAVSAHVVASDPHGDRSYAASLVTTHAGAADPHGDRAYADGLFAANDAMLFKGAIDCSANPNYPAASAGHTYKVSVAGKIGGGSGPNVEVGDTLICAVDGTSSGNHATVGANWYIVQANLDGAVIGPTSAVSGRVATFSGTSGKLIADSGVTLGTAAPLNVAASGDAASGEVVKGNDTRLRDSATITELIRDTIASALIEGDNITITVDDNANTITIAAADGGGGGGSEGADMTVSDTEPVAVLSATFTDDFNRANETPIAAPYTALVGATAANLDTNKVKGTVAGHSGCYLPVGQPTFDISLQFTGSGVCGLMLGSSDINGDYFLVQANASSGYAVYKVLSGSASALTTGSYTFGGAADMYAWTDGTTLIAVIDGVEVYNGAPGGITLDGQFVAIDLVGTGALADGLTVNEYVAPSDGQEWFQPTTRRSHVWVDGQWEHVAGGVTVTDVAGTTLTLGDDDHGQVKRCTSGSAVTVTLPADIAIGTSVDVLRWGAGTVTFDPGSGATVQPSGTLDIADQYSAVTALVVAADTWVLLGPLSA